MSGSAVGVALVALIVAISGCVYLILRAPTKMPKFAARSMMSQEVADGIFGGEPEVSKDDLRQRHLQQSQRLEGLGLAAGEIAHDFNNLLMSVQGHVELALDGLDDLEWTRTHLSKAISTIDRATGLTRQMLAYSGQGQTTINTLDLSSVVQDISSLFEVSIDKKARLNVEMDSEVVPMSGDASQIRQVVMNLVGNASDSLGGSPGEITVRTGTRLLTQDDLEVHDFTHWAEPGRFATLEVRDSGCGMDEVTAQRVFDPFFSTKKQGRGLGLAAVQGIVKGHQGYIALDSTLGAGTTFTVGFPYVDADVERPHINTACDCETKFRGTALLAEDELAVRVVTRRMLENFGFEVIDVADGREALNCYAEKSERLDLVILDMTMPEVSGCEAAAEIRAQKSDQRILLISGYSRLSGASNVLDDRTGFLQKPFRSAELGDTLKGLVADLVVSA